MADLIVAARCNAVPRRQRCIGEAFFDPVIYLRSQYQPQYMVRAWADIGAGSAIDEVLKAQHAVAYTSLGMDGAVFAHFAAR